MGGPSSLHAFCQRLERGAEVREAQVVKGEAQKGIGAGVLVRRSGGGGGHADRDVGDGLIMGGR